MGEQPRCPDCGVAPGEFHEPGCDVERCFYCGGQFISCQCNNEQGLVAANNPLPWTGIWPGAVECEKYDLWCKMGPNGWEKCSRSDPEASHDLNRLYTEFEWNRTLKTFVPKSDPSLN